MTPLLGDAFGHHVWATRQLLEACAGLTEDQLAAAVPGTYGSIISTLRHIVAADRWYLSFFPSGQGLARVRDEDDLGVADLAAAMADNGAAWEAVVAGEIDPDAVIVEPEEGGSLHTTLGERLAQVVHHGTDHRSQVCTALTSLGLEPPDIDVWAFGRATGREWFVSAGDS